MVEFILELFSILSYISLSPPAKKKTQVNTNHDTVISFSQGKPGVLTGLNMETVVMYQ